MPRVVWHITSLFAPRPPHLWAPPLHFGCTARTTPCRPSLTLRSSSNLVRRQSGSRASSMTCSHVLCVHVCVCVGGGRGRWNGQGSGVVTSEPKEAQHMLLPGGIGRGPPNRAMMWVRPSCAPQAAVCAPPHPFPRTCASSSTHKHGNCFAAQQLDNNRTMPGLHSRVGAVDPHDLNVAQLLHLFHVTTGGTDVTMCCTYRYGWKRLTARPHPPSR